MTKKEQKQKIALDAVRREIEKNLIPFVAGMITQILKDKIDEIIINMQLPEKALIQATTTLDALIRDEAERIFNSYKDQIDVATRKLTNQAEYITSCISLVTQKWEIKN